MKIGVFGDMHGFSDRITAAYNSLHKERPDVFVCLGDTVGNGRLKSISSTLDYFSSLPGEKIYVAGNHDLWVNYPAIPFLVSAENSDSLTRYQSLEKYVNRSGFSYLDTTARNLLLERGPLEEPVTGPEGGEKGVDFARYFDFLV